MTECIALKRLAPLIYSLYEHLLIGGLTKRLGVILG